MQTPARHLRLSELNEQIAATLRGGFPSPVWVIAEIANATTSRAGHSYYELVEKWDDTILANLRGMVWKYNTPAVQRFEQATGKRLAAGIEVLLLAHVSFHPRFGLSLDIQDIDPNYTLGDLARKRQEVIDRLEREELLHVNKLRPFPPVPQRIAVVSSETAAGYGDFTSRLSDNPYGYAFQVELFAANVQGDEADASLCRALEKVCLQADRFDCVVIVRGGGGTVDLSCFDGYGLCKGIAELPLPVVTGIGHDRDASVADLVAFHNAPTPTAAAEFIISRVRAFDLDLDSLAVRIGELAGYAVRRSRSDFDSTMVRFVLAAQQRLDGAEHGLQGVAHRAAVAVRTTVENHSRALTLLSAKVQMLPSVRLAEQAVALRAVEKDVRGAARGRLRSLETELQLLAKDVHTRDPQDVLRRGFSITRIDGRAITDASQVPEGGRIETRLYRGRILSTVTSAQQKHDASEGMSD